MSKKKKIGKLENEKVLSMTSAQKPSHANSPKTQFLQNFTKKKFTKTKFMISTALKTNATPIKSPITNPMALPISLSSQNQSPNVSFKEALMHDMNIDLESPFEGNIIDMVLIAKNQLPLEEQTSQGTEKQKDIIALSP